MKRQPQRQQQSQWQLRLWQLRLWQLQLPLILQQLKLSVQFDAMVMYAHTTAGLMESLVELLALHSAQAMISSERGI